MKQLYVNYLNDKGILISNEGKDVKDVLFSAADRFGVVIEEGAELASLEIIKQLEETLGINVPDPFYTGFPESVLRLTPQQLLYDQLQHYIRYEWLGENCDNGDTTAGESNKYSVLEDYIVRTVLTDNVETKKFKIVNEEEAVKLIIQYAEDLFAGTRPLSTDAYALVREVMNDYSYTPSKIASMNTAVKLILDTRDAKLAKHIHLQDVIKLVDELITAQNRELITNANGYTERVNAGKKAQKLNKLNLKNRDRKFITEILDYKMAKANSVDIALCCEKKKIWAGLLHHIHYTAKTKNATTFVNAMRGDKNYSYLSEFEKLMKEGRTTEAAKSLCKNKGASMGLRNMNYLLSRCKNETDVDNVINTVLANNTNPIVTLQLLMSYYDYDASSARNFVFTRHNQLVNHSETVAEFNKRGTKLDANKVDTTKNAIRNNLVELYKSAPVGKVYIAPEMKNMAMPLSEASSQNGFGVMPKGSRVSIPANVRVFTYWERTGDVDLSCSAVDSNFKPVQHFYWNNMHNLQSGAITFSGDERNGWYGGSEFFDVRIDDFKKRYPKAKYLIFNNNCYSVDSFAKITCTAGYMDRNNLSSGRIFEPKTVKTSFKIDCDGSQCHLFAIDLDSKEMIWLNAGVETTNRVAASGEMAYLSKYINATSIMNVAEFFTMKATEVVENVEDADVVVSDTITTVAENQKLVKSTDVELIMKLMNNKPLVDETKATA